MQQCWIDVRTLNDTRETRDGEIPSSFSRSAAHLSLSFSLSPLLPPRRASVPTSFSAYTRPYSRHRPGEGRTPRRETWERWHTDSLPHIPFCLFNVFVFTRSREWGSIRGGRKRTLPLTRRNLSFPKKFLPKSTKFLLHEKERKSRRRKSIEKIESSGEKLYAEKFETKIFVSCTTNMRNGIDLIDTSVSFFSLSLSLCSRTNDATRNARVTK